MALVVGGLFNKQIASEMATSEITVKVHRAQVMQKMRAESLADLVRLAERLGPLSPAVVDRYQRIASRSLKRTVPSAAMSMKTFPLDLDTPPGPVAPATCRSRP